MADKVQFDLVSPERSLVSEAVDMVVVPGVDGDFGVLPQHSPMMTLLRPGVITTYEGDRPVKRIFVAGGFAEANPAGVIVLAEAADVVGEVTADQARQLLRNAEEDLSVAASAAEADRAKLEQAVAVAQARVEAMTAPA
ncbi:MAG TPA: ATP synthase F1 subunit epsilon [Geminicoccus sp.]|uniref:ATP synthase F1 subunit epsilon n=1 Tax=Geminicoccus sp. TaxID=2024832 RepID=UPI002E30B8D6|nr:ATP synthase F1 subunit epsilon [Geminicoccus sp.]HEX2527283.1 ATP synthase F1 subunit epsilon [Geminicoccus sp.]